MDESVAVEAVAFLVELSVKLTSGRKLGSEIDWFSDIVAIILKKWRWVNQINYS